MVGERIYALTHERALEALEEQRFSTEDELQALIAEHPELLDGEQISPGDARRWILVSREKGIAESSGAAARWAVDHLIIDQDAVPTLVELKRGSNPTLVESCTCSRCRHTTSLCRGAQKSRACNDEEHHCIRR